ncbi:peptidoglycan editing factor PgeF [uncultured Paraglaciecola sp.]|uniref:peptidoglycan editing factor PgeF n=1 Tax=uncultured Paraglaciecola sp. TaxID=1765024 RepID=UPI00345B8746
MPPFDSLNIAQHVGDNPKVVNKNRQQLPNFENFVWLNQTHSNVCINLGRDVDRVDLSADACFSNQKHLVCAVMTADCLPILLCNQQGTYVAAVHAGWRGLANGVIENTLAAMPTDAQPLLAWMGPAISQNYFEVGSEVKHAFRDYSLAFKRNNNSNQEKYFVDLYQIAKQKMLALGITQIYGGEYCTYQQSELFFSHRRASHQANMKASATAATGRVVSAIYLD